MEEPDYRSMLLKLKKCKWKLFKCDSWYILVDQKTAEKSMQRNQARQAALKALEEDPTVFQYDEIYDDMQQKKEEKKPVKEEKKVCCS